MNYTSINSINDYAINEESNVTMHVDVDNVEDSTDIATLDTFIKTKPSVYWCYTEKHTNQYLRQGPYTTKGKRATCVHVCKSNRKLIYFEDHDVKEAIKNL